MPAHISIQGHILGTRAGESSSHEVVIRWRGEVVARMNSDASQRFSLDGLHPEIFGRIPEGYTVEVDGQVPSAVVPTHPLDPSNAVSTFGPAGELKIVVPFTILLR